MSPQMEMTKPISFFFPFYVAVYKVELVHAAGRRLYLFQHDNASRLFTTVRSFQDILTENEGPHVDWLTKPAVSPAEVCESGGKGCGLNDCDLNKVHSLMDHSVIIIINQIAAPGRVLISNINSYST